MKFALLHFPQLDRRSVSTSNTLILEAAKKRGHTMEVINAYDCQIDIASGSVLYKEKVFPAFDAILVRPGIGEDTLTEISLIRQLEGMGYVVVNKASAIAKVKNKAWQYQLLKEGGFTIPKTWIIQSKESYDSVIKEVVFPLVLKTIQGNQGTGVLLAESARALSPMIDYFTHKKETILLQEYIESQGSDIRLFVVGGNVVATMQRKAPQGEFRSNAHVSCETVAVSVSEEEKQIAQKASEFMGLEVAGVDLLRGAKGIYLLEVNANPGLEFVSKASGVNVADRVVEYLEKVAAK